MKRIIKKVFGKIFNKTRKFFPVVNEQGIAEKSRKFYPTIEAEYIAEQRRKGIIGNGICVAEDF